MQSISNIYVSHLILYLPCKCHDNIPNNCQDIANLLLGYFNLGHLVQYDMITMQIFDVLSKNWQLPSLL